MKSLPLFGIVRCIPIAFGIGFHSLPAAPLVFDKEIGHYKDLAYRALSDEGLSWEQRTRLFGGDTIHYTDLSKIERKRKTQELDNLLAKFDDRLVAQCDNAVRGWLDKQIENLPPTYEGGDVNAIRSGAVVFFRAFEIFGEQEYLEAGLARADIILKAQWPKGHWPWPGKNEDFVRIQDGFNDWPFWIMLYAHKLSGDKKYFAAGQRCAELLLSLQRKGGGWPDQWSFSGRASGNTGVRNGITFNDSGTTSTFQMMVMMTHLTGDEKYVAGLTKLGSFIAKANLGEGEVVGWAEQYDDNAKAVRARQYEIELPYPRALTRATGPMLIWLYLITGDEAHMDLLRKAYAWHEKVRQKELDLDQLEAWKEMAASWTRAGRPMHYRPGWPDAWLPDGSNWGRVTAFKLIPWFPVTDEMKKKNGGAIHRSETDGGFPGNCGYLPKWGDDIRAGGQHPECSMGFSHAARGNSLSEVRRALLEHKRGGRDGLLEFYGNPTKFTSDQYLQVRIDAAKRALDPRNVNLASDPEGMGFASLSDPSHLIGQKTRWHGGVAGEAGRSHKWGAAFKTSGQYGSVAWYQWQLVYDAMLARGKVTADTAARGGRGLGQVASQTHLDSWDVLGEWGMAVHEIENHFDVPIEKK
jgi:hypothetical protein